MSPSDRSGPWGSPYALITCRIAGTASAQTPHLFVRLPAVDHQLVRL